MMDIKMLLTVSVTVFLAELGDKTQLATMLFACDKEADKTAVFLGSCLALILASAIGVLFGAVASDHINEKYLNYFAGAGFILVGVWTLAKS